MRSAAVGQLLIVVGVAGHYTAILEASLLPCLGGGDLSSSKILPQTPNSSTISISGLVQLGLRGGSAPHESLSLGGQCHDSIIVKHKTQANLQSSSMYVVYCMQLLSWKRILRLLAVLSLLVAIGWVYFDPGFEPVLTVLGAIATFITSFFVGDMPLGTAKLPTEVTLYETDCGNKGVDLANQRLRVSAAFGAYFTSLLEKGQSYIPLSGQIDCPTRKGQEGLPPIQRIFWHLQNPKGPRIFILAAEGGMGKSTLTSKLVRCLYEQEVVDMILGDSAKSAHIDPVSGQMLTHTPGYESVSAFYQRLCTQLGVPYKDDELALSDVRRRLVNRRAVIVVDNLETVVRDDRLLLMLQQISGRDIRAIVTTRRVTGLSALDKQHLLVRLNPLQEPEVVTNFLQWHIEQHQHTHPDLVKIQNDIADKKKIAWLVEKSGGVPLLMQLLVSDVAPSSWEQMRQLPTLFGAELIDFLYEARWQELNTLGQPGLLARELLLWLKQAQYSNRKITAKRLTEWAKGKGQETELNEALTLLHERFLIVNSNLQKGNYAIFPSLTEFLQKQG